MRRPLVAGNWKMNCGLAQARELTAELDRLIQPLDAAKRLNLAIFPPYVHLAETASALAKSDLRWGAQNVSEYDNGAYTGEISAAMLKDYGCHYVLVGHSERRALYGETPEQVAAKFAAARKADLQPVLCVGETLAERDQGATEQTVAAQLQAVTDAVGIQSFAHAVVAYEPVWAIGTGKTATPEQAQAVHAFIRSRMTNLDATIAASVRILYGGSVKASNAAALFQMNDIDGGLIGGASLDAAEFASIAEAAAKAL